MNHVLEQANSDILRRTGASSEGRVKQNALVVSEVGMPRGRIAILL